MRARADTPWERTRFPPMGIVHRAIRHRPPREVQCQRTRLYLPVAVPRETRAAARGVRSTRPSVFLSRALRARSSPTRWPCAEASSALATTRSKRPFGLATVLRPSTSRSRTGSTSIWVELRTPCRSDTRALMRRFTACAARWREPIGRMRCSRCSSRCSTWAHRLRRPREPRSDSSARRGASRCFQDTARFRPLDVVPRSLAR